MSTLTFSVRRRDLAWGVALIVLLTTIWIARSDIADAGATPPGEGIAVVYVAVGTGFADSLGVGPGAGANGAPIIIVPTDPPMNAATSAELVRLDPRSVVIVGGTAVVSAPMETAIGALLPNAVVSRIAGANRYETNAMFSEATFPIEGWASIPAAAFTSSLPQTDVAYIASGVAVNSTTGAMLAPIQLPHGSEILELQAWGYDNATEDLVVELFAGSLDGSGTVIATTSTSGTPFDIVFSTDVIGSPTVIDNETTLYVVTVAGSGDFNFSDGDAIYLHGVMVRYRLGASTG